MHQNLAPQRKSARSLVGRVELAVRGPRQTLLTLFALLLLGTSARAGAPDISVAIDKQSVSVGDPITYTLSVQYDSIQRLIAPVVAKTLGKLEVLHDTTFGAGPSGPGRKLYRRQLRLAAFETGSLWVAALHGETVDPAGNSVPWQSDSLLISIASVLADAGTDTTDIRGLKEPYHAPEFRWWLWGLIALALVAVAAFFWLRRRKQQALAVPPPPPPPAWETALYSLWSMRQEIDPDSDGGRLWYFRLSEILRRYFDQRFGWASIDETTTEVMQRLESAPFDSGHRERAQEFFQLADRVRYARHLAKVGRPEVDWEWIQQFVRSTIPAIPAVPLQNEATPNRPATPASPNPQHVDVTA